MRLRVVSQGVLLMLAAATAWAGNGAGKLKGQIVVSDQPVPAIDDEDKIADVLKKWQRAVIEKAKDSDAWTFHMMMFPDRKPGVTTLSLLFYDVSGGKHNYLTSKDISCDAAATILASDVDVSEEDGVKAGMKVELSLAKIVGDKQTELAKTKLTFK